MKINSTSLTNAKKVNKGINENSKNVAFTSNPTRALVSKKSLMDLFEPLRGGNMSRNMFILAGFSFLLSGRLLNSRDKNERRETLTRDVPTIILAVQGTPWVENFVSKIIEKNTGFAITTKDLNSRTGKIDQKIPPLKQLRNWYKFNEELHSGFDGFAERLSSLGANLKKVFSRLDDNFKNGLSNFSEDNKMFMKQLSAAENKDLKQAIQDAFKNKDGNKALKQASFLNAVPKLIGIIATLGLVGIFIPMLNIFITEAVNSKHPDEHHKKNDKTKKA